MISLSGYKIKEQIYDGSNSIVFRGLRDSDGERVVLKLLKGEYPSRESIAKFKREYDIGKKLNLEGTLKVYDLEKYQHSYIIIEEDVKAKPLLELLPFRKLDIDKFLTLAIRICRIVGECHKKNIVHKDINPSNVIWNPKTGTLKIIDFGISTELARENPEAVNPNKIDGTLAYMSPEQTGRMNRSIDYRTDFYSMGVLFYQILTGSLPFESKDPIVLVHSHIAKIPMPPRELNAKIPEAISNIVMRLLEKTPEDRYQSAQGIIADLQKCSKQYRGTGFIKAFVLGKNDLLNYFSIPEKLYGRELEIEMLLESFDRVIRGQRELVLVSGYPGVGKTSLVNEIQKPILTRNGNFISGKFDKLKREVPYASITQAFGTLVQSLLADTEKSIELWKRKLLNVLGANGRLITDLIPELELIIGEQPEVPKLGPTASQNRFNMVFQNFIRAFISEESPMVLFMDDLQWADLSSLKLLELLVVNPANKNLLVVAAYREGEVGVSHPVTTTANEIKNSRVNICEIKLKPLKLENIQDMLSDVLHIDNDTVLSLAKLCLKKTHGNPFFLNQFLKILYEEGLLSFSSHELKWVWDVEKIQAQGITDNVVDLMVKKINQLSEMSRKIIQYASCIGNRFDLQTLSKLSNKPMSEVLDLLLATLVLQYVLPVDDSYKYVYESDDVNPKFRFLHDRIHRAAYQSVSIEEKKELHHKIANIMLSQLTAENRMERIFDIVNHLNMARELIHKEGDRYQASTLNLIAGKKARNAAAYDTALGYFESGISFMASDPWKKHYGLAIDLYSNAAESAYLSGAIDKVEEYGGIVISHARSTLDKIRVQNIRISMYVNNFDFAGAIKIVMPMLSSLGVKMSEKPNTFTILWNLIKTRFSLLGKDVDTLRKLPRMTDPNKKSALRIILTSAPALISLNPKLAPIMFLTILRISLKYGNSELSPMSYMGYGVIQAGFLRHLNRGYKYGKFAVELVEELDAVQIKPMVYAGYNNFIRHGKEHVRNTFDMLREGYHSALEVGDVIFANLNMVLYIMHRFSAGCYLPDVKLEAEGLFDISGTDKHNLYVDLVSGYVQSISNLLGESLTPYSLQGKYFDEEKMVKYFQERGNSLPLFVVYVNRSMLGYLFGRYEEAYSHSKKVDKVMKGFVKSLFVYNVSLMFGALSALKLYPSSNKARRKELLKFAEKKLKILKVWAKNAPMNYEHKYFLIKAEMARVLGDCNAAAKFYDKAISGASKNDFTNDEALANELAAEYYLEIGREKIARVYFKDAHYAYSKWGAKAKVSALEERYPTLMSLSRSGEAMASFEKSLTMTSMGTRMSEALDLISVMKASQAISREIKLEKIISRLLHILIENTGANKGVFLLLRNKALVIEGVCDAEGKTTSVLKSIPVTSLSDLPLSLLKYVQRTHENVVLSNAAEEGRFVDDPYFYVNKTKSVLCSPILHHADLIGVLYFENNLVANVFTEDRLEILELLSNQASISIENARLYQSFERFVPKQFLKLLGKRSMIDVKLGDNTQEDLSVLFCDIRNFTARSEQMSPKQVFSFVNDYLSYLGPVIERHEGFIDKYIGDAIMALFPGGPENALEAAVELQQALTEFNRKYEEEGEEPIEIGIGINTGLVMLGMVGEPQRMDGSVFGDAVNTASRLEGLNKIYGTTLLVSEGTIDSLENASQYNMRIIDRVKVHGKSETIRIWQILDGLPEVKKYSILSIKDDFERAWQLYQERKFEEAKALFTACLQKLPGDKPCEIFVKRCQRFIDTGCPEDWNGAMAFLHKLK